jgi:hypothetical protein
MESLQKRLSGTQELTAAPTNPQKSALRSVGAYALPLPARSSHGAIVAAIGVTGP